MGTLGGSYQLAPGVVLSVTQKGDRLFAQLTGQRAFRVFPAATADHFQFRVVPAELQFERNDEGKVTAVTLLQNGQAMRSPRI